MRYHKAGLAALATQPSHQFDREGVLVLKERHDSFFRRSEVSSERWCRLRGNLLCYFKSRDHWSEPAGVLVLENCTVTLEETATHCFTIEFGTGCHQVCEAASEADRDAWVAAIRATALPCLAAKVQELLQQLALKKDALQSVSPAKREPAPGCPSVLLELSLCCDNLRCDGTGLSPSSCVAVQLMPQCHLTWTTCHTTEVIQGSSNPLFVSSVVVGNSMPVEDSCRVRLVVRRVLDPLSHTSTVLGMALTSIGSIRSSVRQRLALLSLSGDAVGFVSVTSWAGDSDPAAGVKHGDHGPLHSTPTHTQNTDVYHHRRTQSLPPRLSSKSKLPTPPQLCPMHTNLVTATYRFHSGLGGDIAVVEMMAESKLTFTLPQQLLSIWLGAERAWQEEVEALGVLSEPWHSRQRALVAMHSSRSQLYQDASTALAACSDKGQTMKRSCDKENPLLEFAPVNLHLQRVWAQNESLRRTGFYDVHTVGAFAANALGCSHGGLLTLLQEHSRRCRDEASGRAECSRAGVETTRRLRSTLAACLNTLLATIRTRAMLGVHAILQDIRHKIDLLLSALEPDMVEAAFDFLDQIKVPQSPSHLLTLASRNYSVHSNLAGYLSPESSLDKTIGMHVDNSATERQQDTTPKLATDIDKSNRIETISKVLTRPNDGSLNKVPDVRLGKSTTQLISPATEIPEHPFEANNSEAKYYCSTDEPEPWDLIKLNLQASYICLSAKVNALYTAHNQKHCSSPGDRLAPLAHIDGLSETSAVSCDLLIHQTVSADVSPTEGDSGIGMERITPEYERKPLSNGAVSGRDLIQRVLVTADKVAMDKQSRRTSNSVNRDVKEKVLPSTTENVTSDTERLQPSSCTNKDISKAMLTKVSPEADRKQASNGNPVDLNMEESTLSREKVYTNDIAVGNPNKNDHAKIAVTLDRVESCEASVKSKLACIMETSREDTVDGDDLNAAASNASRGNVLNNNNNNNNRFKKTICVSSDKCSPVISSTNSVSNSSVCNQRTDIPSTCSGELNVSELKSHYISVSENCKRTSKSNVTVDSTDGRLLKNKSQCVRLGSKEASNCAKTENIPVIKSTNNPSNIKPTNLPVSNQMTHLDTRLATNTSNIPDNIPATNTTGTLDTRSFSNGLTNLDTRPGAADEHLASTAAAAAHKSDICSVVPSIIKLRGAVDGAVRTARLVHSLHRLQLPTDGIHQTHGLQYRRDVCFAQALTTIVSGLMGRLWSRAADQTFLAVLQHLGPLVQCEGLLSCYGGDGARLSDMVVAIEDLATVQFVLVADANTSGGGDAGGGGGSGGPATYTPYPAVTGNRCSLRVVLPVPESVLCLLPPRDPASDSVTFHITPVFFNVGINEEATLAGKLGLEGPQHRNNLDSFHRLAEYHHRYAKLNLPVENTKRVWSNNSSSVSLSDLMARLRTAVHANKSKNTDVLTLAAAATRVMAGLRFTSCKSGKDRTGMSVTLEQTNLLAAEFDLARTEVQRSLQAMRSEGTRLVNCQKNINVKKFAFNSIQLSMFPRNYVPPHGTYGATTT